jgi:UDP-N-acetylglucosamine 2-epimerase
VILTVVGARPQFVKAAILSRELRAAGIQEEILHTGQHYDYRMSEVFFDELGLPGATINLNIGSGTHGTQTAEMLIGIERILLEKRNTVSAVLLYGDTNSTVAGALAAAKLQVPIIHVEAGLRSFNRAMPEEINRITTDHLSSLLFCSSEEGAAQLRKEGITEGVSIPGDIMLDAFQTFTEVAEEKVSVSEVLGQTKLDNYCLMTIHRPANTESETNIKQLLEVLAKSDYSFVWPMHPRNKSRLSGFKIPWNVHLFEPFSYFEMMVVLKGCRKVITDSGGLQKEAYWAKKPCITIRTETEWVETLHNGWNILASADANEINAALNRKIDETSWTPLYGDGAAGFKIVKAISQNFY